MTFSPTVLRSEANFEKFLFGQQTIEAVKAQARQPFKPGEARMGPWQVTWIAVTSPFRYTYALFLKATSYLLVFVFDAQKQGLKLFAQAVFIEYDADRWSRYARFGDTLLVSTLNTAAVDAEDVYTHRPIPLDQIPDRTLRNRFSFYQKDGQIHLQKKPSGQCYGQSEFFSHLYFQTKAFFHNEEQHLTTLAKVFANGAPREAVLWQLAQHQDMEKPILGLEKRLVETTKSPTAEKVQKVFERLKPGLYAVVLDGATIDHRINIIKGKGRCFAFDVNPGLIDCSNPQDLKALSRGFAKSQSIRIFETTQR